MVLDGDRIDERVSAIEELDDRGAHQLGAVWRESLLEVAG